MVPFDHCPMGHGEILQTVPSASISLAELLSALRLGANTEQCLVENGSVCCLFSTDTNLGLRRNGQGASSPNRTMGVSEEVMY